MASWADASADVFPAQSRWKAHDMNRPRPPVVVPPQQHLPAPVPPDAVVLFSGRDLSQWRSSNGAPPKWIIRDGAIESVPGSGYLYSAQSFGDVQLHVEWATPADSQGQSQGKGNSGVFLMSLYEVQVLDSFKNDSYPDGQAGSVYGQYPPLVNASRPPGEWQTFDIIFRRPRFRRDGTLAQPARMTVLHNGLLIQDHVELWGPTSWLQHQPYAAHPEKLPLALQDHGNPVRYRNIWVRPLRETDEPGPAAPDPRPVLNLPQTVLDQYVGQYRVEVEAETIYTVSKSDGRLQCHFFWHPLKLDLVPHAERLFSLRWTAGDIEFEVKPDGKVSGLLFRLGGEERRAVRVD